jgi:hypothetical protein
MIPTFIKGYLFVLVLVIATGLVMVAMGVIR